MNLWSILHRSSAREREQRDGQKTSPASFSAWNFCATMRTGKPKFRTNEALVIFVLGGSVSLLLYQVANCVVGGPGAGKGTQCVRIASEFGFTHLCGERS